MNGKFLTVFLFLISMTVFGQKKISGTITDATTNDPVPGVSVYIKGTTTGVTSDFDGKYTLEASEGDVLVFSHVAYVVKEVTVDEKDVVDVVLTEDANSLDEVVVVGYGTQKKDDLTGSVAVVEMDDVNKRVVSTVDQALQGQVAGVDVTANSGTPGGSVNVRIRGIGTLNSAYPLYVVDGMMVNDIAFLNQNDIESMQILKDASASAIYGSRGSNGVIIITTKKGKGKGVVNVSYYAGNQNFWRTTNVMDAPTWGALTNEAAIAAGRALPVANPESLETTDWFDEVSNTDAFISGADASASGGGEKGSYYVGGSYFTQDGIIKKTTFNRTTFKVNTSLKVKPWLTIGENLALSRSRSTGIGQNDEYTSALITSIAINPASPVRNEDGTFAPSRYSSDTWNPVAILAYTDNKWQSHRTVGNVFADIKFLKNFTFRSNFSGEYTFSEGENFKPVYYVSSVQKNEVNNLTVDSNNLFIGQWTNTLTYDKTINDHHVTALVGVEQYRYNVRYNSTSVNGLPSGNRDIRIISNAEGSVGDAFASGSLYEERQLSYLGRINYEYKDKYLFTANFRADASSKFTKKYQWGYYPSFSLGWKLSKESFFENMDNLTNLKLRLGWGQIGNQGSMPAYQTATYAFTGYNYLWGSVLAPGVSFPGVGNDELKWETSTTTNAGIDFGFFNNKLSGSIDYFNKVTTDMLLKPDVPGQTGIQSPPFQNVGEMKNTGLELALSYKNKDNELKYGAGLVFSKINNKVVSLGGVGSLSPPLTLFNGANPSRTAEGRSVGEFYGRRTDGLFQNQAEIDAQTAQTGVAPGDVRYVDADNDGEVDLDYLGSPLPDFTYGFNFDFEYKGFDLTMAFQGVYGNEIYNATSFYTRSSTAKWNLHRDMVNRWRGEGTQTDARYPRLNANDVNNSLISDRYIEDGSYLRFKTLQLGYNLPASLLEKAGISKARIYVNGQNVYTFTKYSGVDPEIGVSPYSGLETGIDRGYYPVPRIYTLGINLTF